MDQAKQAYTAGVEESSACTMTFTRPSPKDPGHFGVTASVLWDAAWTSSTGRADGLPERETTETTLIRVAQSQALVTQVD